ncbi:MAG TPA: deoxyribose-phosphate aldolase, partial [Pseudonocardiaceae bacterium]
MAAPSTTTPLPPDLAEVTRDEVTLRRFLAGLPGVDQVGVEQRAATLATRSIKKAS